MKVLELLSIIYYELSSMHTKLHNIPMKYYANVMGEENERQGVETQVTIWPVA